GIRHLGVRLQTVRILDDLRERHRAARHDRRPVTGLAAEIAMRTAREPLERVHHQVAREAEIVVVLDVVVGPVELDAGPDRDCGQAGAEYHQQYRRDAPDAPPQALQYSAFRLAQSQPASLKPPGLTGTRQRAPANSRS